MATKKRTSGAVKKATNALQSTKKPGKYVMVVFGRSHEAVAAAFEERARQLDLSRSALGREIIRHYFGFSTHLPK